MTERIRILLVDDHAVVRQGFRSLLEKQGNLEVVGEAADGEEAYVRLQTIQPDVTIMDISMPGQSGIETLIRFRQRDPACRVVVFTMHRHCVFAEQAMRAGARGYVTKSSAPDVLVRAIYDVEAGKRVLSPDIAQDLAVTKLIGEHHALESLTPREFEILRLYTGGRSTRDIAELLHISPKTAANAHYEIKRKLSVRSDVELVHLALRLKIVDLIGLPDT